MNLTKLLPIGRCVKQSKTVFGKYKASQQSRPRFASTVRPLTTCSPIAKALLEKANSAPVVTAAPIPKDTVVPDLSQTEFKAAVAVIPSAPSQTQKIPTGKILSRSEGSPEPVLKKDIVTLASRIREKISAVKKKMQPVRSKKKSGAAPVQTEWALGVQVVRNDLSDADLEIVAPKKIANDHSATAIASTPKFAGLSEAKNYGYRWIKKTAGLFNPSSPFEKNVTEEVTGPANLEARNNSELVGKI